ncbi:hypothetical protein KAJ83_04165 [Marivibrio halodurans]|uniref:Uncharacterized protein n=1 Tax=Marivibrio halodurans TaxID=2039722 RepID=A0A8J7SLF3_9PROT|nr:hypothetical protein [Marivibrio halodurans]MBP5856191.1 hypothetical protein [Marivibrio halodurans]
MRDEEKKALRAAMGGSANSQIIVSVDGGECYRYQNDPFAFRGRAVRAPDAGRIRWHASPGPISSGAHLADVIVGGEARAVTAPADGHLGRPLTPGDMWVDHGAALAVLYDAD